MPSPARKHTVATLQHLNRCNVRCMNCAESNAASASEAPSPLPQAALLAEEQRAANGGSRCRRWTAMVAMAAAVVAASSLMSPQLLVAVEPSALRREALGSIRRADDHWLGRGGRVRGRIGQACELYLYVVLLCHSLCHSLHCHEHISKSCVIRCTPYVARARADE